MSFCLSKAARISGTVVSPSAAILFTLFEIVEYSITVGKTRMPSNATRPLMIAQNSNPKSVIPPCFRLPRSSTVMRRCSLRSLEGSNSFQIAEIHPDEEGLAHDVLVRDEAPEPRVHGVV